MCTSRVFKRVFVFAKFDFDTAENGLLKVCQKIARSKTVRINVARHTSHEDERISEFGMHDQTNL